MTKCAFILFANIRLVELKYKYVFNLKCNKTDFIPVSSLWSRTGLTAPILNDTQITWKGEGLKKFGLGYRVKQYYKTD